MPTVTFRQAENRNKISLSMCPCRTASPLCRLGRKDLVASGEVLELGVAAAEDSSGGTEALVADLIHSLESCAASQECHWESAKPCTVHWLLSAAEFHVGFSGTARNSLRSMERHYRALGAALRDSRAQAGFHQSSQREGVWKSKGRCLKAPLHQGEINRNCGYSGGPVYPS